MISKFDLTKLSSLLKDFYMLTKIRITVFDDAFTELVAYPAEIAPFCQVIRTDSIAWKECKKCDMDACGVASRRHSPYIYQCHAGLTESIVPLYHENIMIGYLLFGHVFAHPTHEEGWAVIKELCSDYNVDMSRLKDACYELPIIHEEYILSASHILKAVASYLCLERMVDLKQTELPVRIDEYITEHYLEDIKAQTLCEYFNIGRTSLYDIAKQNYGVGIAEHIRNLRIKKAKTLLVKHPELRIIEVATLCGYNDYNYFITMFKRVVGMPPNQYRKE